MLPALSRATPAGPRKEAAVPMPSARPLPLPASVHTVAGTHWRVAVAVGVGEVDFDALREELARGEAEADGKAEFEPVSVAEAAVEADTFLVRLAEALAERVAESDALPLAEREHEAETLPLPVPVVLRLRVAEMVVLPLAEGELAVRLQLRVADADVLALAVALGDMHVSLMRRTL